jgi:hypothetical protein
LVFAKEQERGRRFSFLSAGTGDDQITSPEDRREPFVVRYLEAGPSGIFAEIYTEASCGATHVEAGTPD